MRKTPTKLTWLLSIFVIFYLGLSINAYAEGRILKFVSDISINADTSVDVTETYTIQASSKDITTYFTRRLPALYEDNQGNKHKIHYQVLQALKNFEIVPYHIQLPVNEWAMYVGWEGALPSSDIYIYTFRYRVKDIIIFSENSNEFSWDATGNYWSFPILSAEVNIQLPQDAKLISYSGFTGSASARSQNFIVSPPNNNKLSFKISQPLQPNSGLFIDLKWSSPLMHQTSAWENLKSNFQLNSGNAWALVILIFLILYYLITGRHEIKYPEEDGLLALIKPYPIFSPATLRYFFKRTFDLKAMTATLVSMATKDFICIQEEDDNAFCLVKTNKNSSKLTLSETTLAKHLFVYNDKVRLTKTYSEDIEKATFALEKSVSVELESSCFLTHTLYLLPGYVLSLLALFFLIKNSGNILFGLNVALSLMSWTIIGYILFLSLMRHFIPFYKHAIIAKPRDNLALLLIKFLVFAGFIVGEVVLLFISSNFISTIGTLIILGIMLMNISFYHFIKIRALQSKLLVSKMTQFKKFLVDHVEHLQSSTIISDFETYLPYAIALDLEKEWDEKFKTLLETIKPKQAFPVWYYGRTLPLGGNLAFASLLSKDLTYALSTSMLPLKNTQGFGGGW